MALSRREFLASSVFTASILATTRTPAQPADPADLSIAEASPLIRSGRLSPSELVAAYVERVTRLNGRLNAFVTLTEERAMQRARELEADLAAGRWRGPLHGIPIGLKDNIDTAGVVTTAGSAVYAARVPTEDAEVVRRLEAAGAIMFGKLNMHEFAFGATSAITGTGPVRNPWNRDRIPGGSSGGSGAAVAARLCAGALGTDTGGSIRIPAAHCGIVGLKPTYGLASIRGIVPLSVSLDHVGPMARTVADAALMLQALAGYDPRDVGSIDAAIPSYTVPLTQTTSSLRVGIPRDLYDDVDIQVLEAVERALDTLEGLTAGTRDVELPPRTRDSIVTVEAYAYHVDHLEARRDQYHAYTFERIARGSEVPATDYAEARYRLELGRKAIAEVFEDVDVLVSPTLIRLPVTVDEALRAPLETTAILARNTSVFNYFGIPSISVPCGLSREGLPIGLQISGPSLGEVDVLRLAHAYQRVTDWHTRTPPQF